MFHNVILGWIFFWNNFNREGGHWIQKLSNVRRVEIVAFMGGNKKYMQNFGHKSRW
jgi:hypothetical protein